VAQDHQVRALPTLIFFRNGRETSRISGSATLGAIAAKLDEPSAR
jgi:hypothetical protein